MTRSHKYNDRDHTGLADGTADEEAHLPRYFTKNGPLGTDPKKVKKEGGGRGNWGREGDEIEEGTYNMANPRRRSNSTTGPSAEFKTKFETIDPEPVFEDYEEEMAHEGPAGVESGIIVKRRGTDGDLSLSEESGSVGSNEAEEGAASSSSKA